VVIVIGPEDRIRVHEAELGLAPRLDYRLIAERLPSTTIEEWHPSPARLQGVKLSRVVRSLSSNLRRAMARVRALPPESVIYSTGETWGIPIALALRLSGLSHTHVMYVHRVFSADWLALLRTLGPTLKVDGWICVTERQCNVLRRALGSTTALMASISQGVDTQFYRPEPHLGTNIAYILAVGAEMRNYDLLFDAVHSLDMPIVIRPSSSWMHRGRNSIGRLPSNVSVVAQPLSYRDLRQLYAGALAVAVPLQDTLQAAGITTILESMAMGKLVVATASRGLPDVLRDGSTGVVVRPDAAALRLALGRCATEEAWREGLAEAALATVSRQVSLETHADQVAAFIDQVAR
jgi:glycosyltransferase involved in cell wall biosynthesis